jgi:hypothetical protein
MAVGTDARIRIQKWQAFVLTAPYNPTDILKMDLVHDALARRHHANLFEAFRAPAQKGEALAIASIFVCEIVARGVLAAEHVDLEGVIDDDVNGDGGIYNTWVDTIGGEFVAQRCHVDKHDLAKDILAENAAWIECEARANPACEKVGNLPTHVFVPNDLLTAQVLEHDAEHEWQTIDARRLSDRHIARWPGRRVELG